MRYAGVVQNIACGELRTETQERKGGGRAFSRDDHFVSRELDVDDSYSPRILVLRDQPTW